MLELSEIGRDRGKKVGLLEVGFWKAACVSSVKIFSMYGSVVCINCIGWSNKCTFRCVSSGFVSAQCLLRLLTEIGMAFLVIVPRCVFAHPPFQSLGTQGLTLNWPALL